MLAYSLARWIWSALLPIRTILMQLRSVSSSFWSDPCTWDKSRLPRDNESVIISCNTTVIYDISESPILGNIYVEGSLVFGASKSSSIIFLNMTILRTGYVKIGSRENPIPPDVKIVIKLCANSEGGSGMHVYGRLEIYGYPISPVSTKLASTAFKGDRVLILRDNVSWKVGDTIIITSTSTNPRRDGRESSYGCHG
ncbi:MAG: G8 domain-containing protein [Desulfurococcales archaeon]|jgi:hypothetical protein|nr:G8 domain-containing protein [Desulfurococcales archaeon]